MRALLRAIDTASHVQLCTISSTFTRINFSSSSYLLGGASKVRKKQKVRLRKREREKKRRNGREIENRRERRRERERERKREKRGAEE